MLRVRVCASQDNSWASGDSGYTCLLKSRPDCMEEILKRAVVCGAGGFIAAHLVKKLKREGYWVRGVDIKEHEFAPTAADEFLVLDLRDKAACDTALTLRDGKVDEVYQLAADMGGMGFIHSAEC